MGHHSRPTRKAYSTLPTRVYATVIATTEFQHTCSVLFLFTQKCTSALVIFDHPQSGVVYTFGRVCRYVCLYVCQTIIYESFNVGSYLHPRHISTDYRVKFIYEGHWVKVKVTRAEKVKMTGSNSSSITEP